MILGLVAVMMTAAASATDGLIPWPVSLGLAGLSVSAMITTFVWLQRQLGTGKLLTAAQSESIVKAEVKGRDDLVALERQRATEQIEQYKISTAREVAMYKELDDEQKKTIAVQATAIAEGVEALRHSIESNRITDHFFSSYLPPRPEVRE